MNSTIQNTINRTKIWTAHMHIDSIKHDKQTHEYGQHTYKT